MPKIPVDVNLPAPVPERPPRGQVLQLYNVCTYGWISASLVELYKVHLSVHKIQAEV